MKGWDESVYRKIAKRHSNIPQDPLPLDIPDQPSRSGGEEGGVQRVRSVDWSLCPWHTHANKETGMVRGPDGALVFREHFRMLGKRSVRCPGSGRSPKEFGNND